MRNPNHQYGELHWRGNAQHTRQALALSASRSGYEAEADAVEARRSKGAIASGLAKVQLGRPVMDHGDDDRTNYQHTTEES
ncbi:MAG: hypothetical protein V3V01_04315 [Acidimicrobiales bacterium]